MSNSSNVDLSHEEIQRYSRHLLLPEVGLEGQKKLKAASVLIIGAGGLGSPITMYLAAAGVGCIGLVDMDIVEVSNLQRQIIHGTENVGELKIESAKRSIARINPFVNVKTYQEKFTAENAMEIARDYDIIIDGTDNFPTRYLVNDVCVLLGKPTVYGSIFRFEGQASVFSAKHGPCYRCLYPEPPPEGLVPNCAEGGVIGVLPGMIGTIQANEAIKIILGEGTPLYNRLLVLDALDMRFRELSISKNPDCQICGTNPTITHLIDYQHFCGISPKTDANNISAEQLITATELSEKLATSTVQIIDVRSAEEYAICAIPDSLLIPLAELPYRLNEINRNAEVIIYCKSGIRGSKAVSLLNDEGFPKVKNLAGGIKAWATEVDEAMPTY